jgi:outer membrane protein assembly factor BamB
MLRVVFGDLRAVVVVGYLSIVVVGSRAAAQAAPACVPPAPAAAADRDRATELLADFPLAAAELLDRVVHERPQDVAAEMLLEAALAGARARRDDAAARLPAPVTLAPLQLAEAELPAHKVRVDPGPAPLRLVKQSSRRNRIVDYGDWFARNGLPPPSAFPLGAPEYVPSSVGGYAIGRVYGHRDHAVAAYGEAYLAVVATGKQPRVFDLSRVRAEIPSLQVNYAQLAGGTLLVQLSHPGYASATAGRTGYVAAFAVDTGALAWQSAPLAANAENFVITGDVLLTGYGFTAEPDFVYVLDLQSGRVLGKTSVQDAPSYLVRKDDRLYVRTYGMDYVFRLVVTRPEPEPPAPALATVKPREVNAPRGAPAGPELACFLRAAAAAVDARDPVALEAAHRALAARSAHRTLTDALGAKLAWVKKARAGQVLDLWTVAPQRLPAPPFARKLFAPTRALSQQRPPKLLQLAVAAADPARALAKEAYRPGAPVFIAPVDEGALPPGARRDLPTHYGRTSLRAIIPSGERLLLVYGGSYLAVVHGTAVERIFDLDGFRHPPRAKPAYKEFAIQNVTFAQVEGDTLYVCNGGGSYARDVYGKKGFLSAIDIASGQLRWRSDPLVCNATFAVYGEYLITGYGFTAEPDYVFLLRLGDGKRLARLPLKSGPDTVTLDGSRVHIETYAHSYAFELR